MKYIEGQNREQVTFLPECIEDMIGEDNPVRVIDAFVDSIDMNKVGFIRSIPKNTGRPGYDPRDLLKLYVYGYFNKIRTSRKLMYECTRNVELFFLLKKLTPDFRTISDFRKDNSKALKNVFHEFSKLCLNLGLFQKELLAIDGSKFRASNSKDNAYNIAILQKKLDRIDRHIREYLEQMDEKDSLEDNSEKLTAEQINEVIKDLRERREKYQSYLDELEETGETQKLLTDPDARRMHSKDGFHCSYNVQTAVDSGSHLIAGYEVTGRNNDQGLLRQVAQKAKEALEKNIIEVVADKGYESRKDILDCVMNGIIPNVAQKYDKDERIYTLEYVENEISEEEKRSTRPEDIKKCLKAGVLPSCYENTGISLEVQGQGILSCFILNDDDTVTCPMGQIMTKVKTKGPNTIYQNKDACRECANRCTWSKNHKTVSFGPKASYVPARVYGNVSKDKINKFPDDLNLYNSFTRKNEKRKKISLKIRPDKEKLKMRMCLSEHPFGTVKWYSGAHYLLCRGKEKVTAEIGLSFLAYNMKRAINMIGSEKLIEGIA